MTMIATRIVNIVVIIKFSPSIDLCVLSFYIKSNAQYEFEVSLCSPISRPAQLNHCFVAIICINFAHPLFGGISKQLNEQHFSLNIVCHG